MMETTKHHERSKSLTSRYGNVSHARPSGWKKLLSKRWVFPAAYMAAAAIIVTILWLNSGTGQKDSKAVPSTTGVGNGSFREP